MAAGEQALKHRLKGERWRAAVCEGEAGGEVKGPPQAAGVL